MKLNQIYQGDALEILKTFPDDFVDTIITSPPYWGLRDYGEETKVVWGGDRDCKHKFDIVADTLRKATPGDKPAKTSKVAIHRTDAENRPGKPSEFCSKCGAWFGQLGLEPTLGLFLEHLLAITQELKRVLKPTGVMFWNHGDCYLSGNRGSVGIDPKYPDKPSPKLPVNRVGQVQKCLALQNYRLILKMIDEQGWILRNSIVWWKPNAMPSSVRDRFTDVYEPVFMLVKRKHYWFDLDAVRITHRQASIERARYPINPYGDQGTGSGARLTGSIKGNKQRKKIILPPGGKNPGDVWSISTRGFPEAHFATFPERLVEPMIKSSCPEEICRKCGKAREKIRTRDKDIPSYNEFRKQWNDKGKFADKANLSRKGLGERSSLSAYYKKYPQTHKELGYTDCHCNAGWDKGIVLDPFIGSGTTAKVARKLGRNWIGIELNKEYIKMAEKRLAQGVLGI